MTKKSKETKPTVAIDFYLMNLQPDRRAYKPSNPLLQPKDNLIVVVDVPLNATCVYNAIEILEKQLTSGNVKIPEPKLTPMGMKFIVDAFEAAMSDPEPKSEEDVEWDDPEPAEKKEQAETWDEEEDELSWEEDEPTDGDLVEVDEDVVWEDTETESTAETVATEDADVEWDEEDL